jgi:hypothetical protein
MRPVRRSVLKLWQWRPKTWPGRLKTWWVSSRQSRAAFLSALRMPSLIVVAPLIVAVTTFALGAAVLIPDEAPQWLRDVMLLGGGDDTATTPWVRWALLVIAVALLLFAHNWGQTAWPDVALILVVFLAAFAAYKEHVKAEDKGPTETPAAATFTLKKGTATATSNLAQGANAIVLVIEPEKVAGDETLFASIRYEATMVDAVSAGVTSEDVGISLERGAKDATAVAFSADLTGASRIYLLPG